MGCISRLLVFIQDNLPFLIQMSGTVYPHPAFTPGFASVMVYKHRRLICLDDVIETRKSVKPYSQKLWKKLGKVKKQMEELKQNCSEWKVQENAGVLPVSLLSVLGELDQLLEEPPSQELVDGILDFYFEVRDFLNISELVDDNYVVYTAFGEDGRFYEKLFCVNPAENLQKCLDKGNSTVFFSATLLPLQ